MPLVPNRFLFKFEFPLHRADKSPKLDGDPARWNKQWLIPPLYELDNEEPTGKVWAAWNDSGLFIACQVEGKKRSPRCDPENFRKSDHLRLMLDMRDTRSIRRATKFCQQFYLLPTGSGFREKNPVAASVPIARAMDDAPAVPESQIEIASAITNEGYALTAQIPTGALAGFDPTENPRIGFFYMLEDTELGNQSLTIGDDLNWWMDPSTWPTAVLTE